jgi:hypothetical protein
MLALLLPPPALWSNLAGRKLYRGLREMLQNSFRQGAIRAIKVLAATLGAWCRKAKYLGWFDWRS